jgi:hypothetical protein
MTRSTVYIETTIVSYLAAWASRDLVRAAQQQITREWWDTRRVEIETFTSELVFIEASAGDPAAAAGRVNILTQLPILAFSDTAIELARDLIASAAMPSAALRDAQHVAIAATNGIDFLLTWNCRHLANAFLRDRIEETCDRAGLRAPKICTPEELLGVEP